MDDPIRRIYRHYLSSGEIAEQNLFSATRAVLFNTNISEYPLATHGGTMLIIRFGEKIFAITALHVFGDDKYNRFDSRDLWIGCTHEGKLGPLLRTVSILQFENLPDDNEDSLGYLRDIAIIELESEEPRVDAFIWDQSSVADVDQGDEITVVGYIKLHSDIHFVNNAAIAVTQPAFIQGFVDPHPDSNETWIRATSDLKAERRETFERQVGNGIGLSGAPVYNETKNGLCGFVVRAGYDRKTGRFSTHFVSARLLEETLQNYDELPRERAFVTRVFD